ncbi:MAG: cache domain-containing protein [Nostoc sp. DedQUE12a]|nr:cache domain-containing protein [Nostoc sp. DedQUE12a]
MQSKLLSLNHLLQKFNPFAWSITVKLSVTFLSVAILPMSFVGYYNLKRSTESIQNSEYYKLELIATSKANRLDQLILDNQNTIKNIATDSRVVNFLKAAPQRRENFRPEAQKVLQRVANTHPNYDLVYLIDKNGICIASTEISLIGRNYAFREYFQQAIAGEAFVSSILIGVTTKREGVFFTYPVYSESGEIFGVAAIKITAADIWAVINSTNEPNISSFLIDEQGIIISHSSREYLYNSLTPLLEDSQKKIAAERRYGRGPIKSLNIPELAAMVKAETSGHTNYYSPIEKNHQIVGYAPLKTQDWVVGVTKPKVIFMAPIELLFEQNITFVLGAGAIAAIVALTLSRKISNPINTLISASRNLEQGNFIQHESNLYNNLLKASRTQDDIGQLVRVFMKMAEEVKVRQQNMELQMQELRIQIDETKKANQVAEITGTQYFQELQYKAKKLRDRAELRDKAQTDYFQNLQKKVQAQKARLQVGR